MLSRRTIRGPAAGFFHTAVSTVRPCQVTSCGIPTLTDSRDPARCPEVTTSSPSHGGEPLAPLRPPGRHPGPGRPDETRALAEPALLQASATRPGQCARPFGIPG